MSAGYRRPRASRPASASAVPCVVALGMGLYMMHNTLQMHATQMAPEARGGALALFATCLFTGQSAGVWLASHAVDAVGTAPVFLVGGGRAAAAGAGIPAPAGALGAPRGVASAMGHVQAVDGDFPHFQL